MPLVEGTEDGCRRLDQAERFERAFDQAIEDQAIVDVDGEALKAQGLKQVVNDQHCFNIRGVGVGADGVEVALVELAVAPVLSILAAPDRADVVALEGCAELADVLGSKAGKRYGQIEAQGHVAAPVIREAIHLLVALVAAFAGEYFAVFKGGRVNGSEAVGAENRAGLVDQFLARHGQGGGEVAEALKGPRRDQFFFVGHRFTSW